MFMLMKSTFKHVDWAQFCDHVLVFVFASSLYAAVVYNMGIYSPSLQRLVGLAFIVAIGIYGYLSRAKWRTTILAIVFIAVVLYGYGYLREFSYDGLQYHAATPLTLDHSISGSTGMRALGGMFWSEHYPKAFEFFAYTAKILTTHFNSGKSFTLLLSVPAFFALMRLFQTAMQSSKTALVAAAACIYNPVAFGQLTTLYVDAAHYYCWTIFSVNLLFAIRDRPYSALQLGIALVLLVTSKMTGAVFAAISILVFFAVAFIGGDKRDFFRKYKSVFGQLAIWFFVAIATIGYSPFVENVVSGKNVLYPVLGTDRVDIISGQVSPQFLSMSRFHKFFVSYFSVPRNFNTANIVEPTFVPSLEHLREAFIALHTADTRFAGFGPFFAVMLIICMIPFFWKRKDADIVKIFLIAVLAIVLIHPQSWWARYVPMLYVVPFLIAAAFSYSRRQLHAIIALAVMNSFFSLASVAGYVILKQTHYQNAVASVREMCNQRPITLTPSSLNWEFDLRDDNLRMTTNSAPAQAECAVNFDKMMIMKK
jgi:hypothetical protein